MEDKNKSTSGKRVTENNNPAKQVDEDSDTGNKESETGKEGLSNTIKDAHAAGNGALERGTEQIGAEKSSADKTTLDGADQY